MVSVHLLPKGLISLDARRTSQVNLVRWIIALLAYLPRYGIPLLTPAI